MLKPRNHRPTIRARRGLRIGSILAVLATTYPAVAEDHSLAQRLVDRGRTIGLTTPDPTLRDAELVLVWMQAAERLDPDLAEARLWQYDLLGRLGRDDEALAALAHYCRLNPADLSARIDLLEGRFERCQSVEKRIEFCQQSLGALGAGGTGAATTQPAGGSAVLRSGLHRRMADVYLSSGDAAQAEEHARRAAEAFPGNAAALALLADLTEGKERAMWQVRASLAAIAAMPADADAMWRLARALEELGMSDEALLWYDRAKSRMETRYAKDPQLNDFRVDYARAHADAGRYEQAFDTAERLVAQAPDLLPARFVLLDVAVRLARAEVAGAQKSYLRGRFKQIAAASRPASLPASGPAARSASQPAGSASPSMAAWYHLLFEPDADAAVRFAILAKESGERRGDIIYGLAKLLAGELEETVRVLTPLAPADPWAAAGLGEALLKQGKREEGLSALRAGEALRGSGLAHERIASLLTAENEPLSPADPPAELVETLRGFETRVLDFPENPAEALRLEVTTPEHGWAFGEPWRCEVKLTNTAPYPIFVGAGRMTEGRVAISLEWGPDSSKRWPGYLSISLHDQPVLAPGASVARALTLDVGPAAGLAAAFPQRDLELTARFVLDAVPGSGAEFVSALSGFPVTELRTKRAAVDASRAGLDRLATQAKKGAEPERAHAARIMGALIRERESALRGPLDYAPRRVDESKLAQELMAALKDPAAVVRAAALDAVGTTTFTKKTFEQVGPLLSDANWLVRLTAIDVLARVQGEKFRPVLERLSAADSDDLVKRAASLTLGTLPPA